MAQLSTCYIIKCIPFFAICESMMCHLSLLSKYYNGPIRHIVVGLSQPPIRLILTTQQLKKFVTHRNIIVLDQKVIISGFSFLIL